MSAHVAPPPVDRRNNAATTTHPFLKVRKGARRRFLKLSVGKKSQRDRYLSDAGVDAKHTVPQVYIREGRLAPLTLLNWLC